jgi:hypothetical protein
MISVTVFKNLFDNKTHRKMEFSDFDKFEELLYTLSHIEREGKRDAELISPAVYKNGTTRANDNVTGWAGWCAIDVDDFAFEGNLENELRNRFGDYRYVCYSTASSTHDLPKFRLVFQLTGEVEAVRIKHFWFALNTNLDQLGDRQTKDLSRMYYIPGRYAGANNFIFSNDGDPIDPFELIAKVPYVEKTGNSFLDRLPDNMKAQVIQYRKDKMQNTSVSWTGYHDCPFFPKNLAAEYRTISNTGWYHKMYQIMVAIAGNAVKNEYPITSRQISELCRQLDLETGNWYENRPLDKEADRAIEYVYRNM